MFTTWLDTPDICGLVWLGNFLGSQVWNWFWCAIAIHVTVKALEKHADASHLILSEVRVCYLALQRELLSTCGFSRQIIEKSNVWCPTWIVPSSRVQDHSWCKTLHWNLLDKESVALETCVVGGFDSHVSQPGKVAADQGNFFAPGTDCYNGPWDSRVLEQERVCTRLC